jgi:hypothetical protein
MAEKEQDKTVIEDKKELKEDNKTETSEKKVAEGEGEKPKDDKGAIGESIQNVRASRTHIDHR